MIVNNSRVNRVYISLLSSLVDVGDLSVWDFDQDQVTLAVSLVNDEVTTSLELELVTLLESLQVGITDSVGLDDDVGVDQGIEVVILIDSWFQVEYGSIV